MRGFEEAQGNDKAQGDKQAGQQLNLLDLQKNDFKVNKSDLLGSGEQTVMPLPHYLAIRDRQEESQSYLRTGTTLLTRAARHMVGAEDVAAKFDEARKAGDNALMVTLQHADHAQRHLEHQVGHYTGAALKTGLLFTGGKVGWVGLTAASIADEAKPDDPFQKQLIDVSLGAAKGVATRFVFNKINEQSWNPVVKGWTIGMSNRFIDVGLSSSTYLNANGEVDMKAGGLKTLNSVFGPQALIVDAGTGLASSVPLMGIDYAMGGKFLSNPVAAKLTIAGVSGLTEGSLQELNHQQDRPKQPAIDWSQVAIKGLQKGALDTISAVPSSGLIKLK